MMKKTVLLLAFFIQGCYLANGSPPDAKFWLKNGYNLSIKDREKCSNDVNPNLGKRYDYLSEKIDKIGFVDFYKNTEEYKEYEVYLDKADKLINQCFYNLGYRFKPPLQWCLAQDRDNTRYCIENMKYRN